MADWVLLLRGVNLGKHNRLSMAVLRELLTDLGHGDVRTVLASGNANFTSPRRSADALAREIRARLRERVDVDLPALVLSITQLGQLLADVPSGEVGYRLVAALFTEPAPDLLADLLGRDFGADGVTAGPRDADGAWLGAPALHLAYAKDVHTSKLQTARLEKSLGVAMTARTPATLAKLLR